MNRSQTVKERDQLNRWRMFSGQEEVLHCPDPGALKINELRSGPAILWKPSGEDLIIRADRNDHGLLIEGGVCVEPN